MKHWEGGVPPIRLKSFIEYWGVPLFSNTRVFGVATTLSMQQLTQWMDTY